MEKLPHGRYPGQKYVQLKKRRQCKKNIGYKPGYSLHSRSLIFVIQPVVF